MNLPSTVDRLVRFGSGVGRLVATGVPDRLLHFGFSPGDDLLCTAVLHELRARGAGDLWIASQHPALFGGNPDVDVVVPPSAALGWVVERLGGKAVRVRYPGRVPEEDRTPPPAQHLITLMCKSAGLGGSVALRTYLRLSRDEAARGRVAQRQVTIMSSGASAREAMRNKEWYPDRFARVVEKLRDEFDFVQVGSARDPLLPVAVDLRGKTTLRETAAVLSQSLSFVGLVGFLMHLARAVDCRAVIVYGGREAPWQSGYTCNANLYTPLPCAPCWLWNTCPYDRLCMDRIGEDEVIEAIRRQAAMQGKPLEVASETIQEDVKTE